jgi:uncharacterized protein YkwD
VSSISKRGFAVLASAVLRSPARRRLGVALLGALAIAFLPAFLAAPQAPVRISAVPASSPGWLNRLNAWRVSTGLSGLSENTTWSAGEYNHAVYMVKNDLMTHYETPGVPYYTAEGDIAAHKGNIQVSSTTSSTDDQVIDWWMEAPFHAMAMMDPRLTETAFGSYRMVKSGWQEGGTLDTTRGNPFTGGRYPVYFPGDGTTEPLTTYTGGESPNPLQACTGYSAPTGLPVFVQVGGNVATTVGAVHSFTGNGVPLAHCVVDSNNTALGSYLTYRGAVVLIPKAPLASGVKYVVALTVNGKPYTWSFTIGQFITSVAPCTSAGLTADSPSQITGTVVTFTATSTACPNPQYLFYVQSPDGIWTLARGYGGPNWAWDTSTLTSVGNYLVDVWVRDAGSGVPYQAVSLLTLNLGPSSPCTGVGLSSDLSSPRQVDYSITFTATSTGCTKPQYLFYLKLPNGVWALARGYGGATWVWNTATVASTGTYLVDVWVRAMGSAARYEFVQLMQYTLTARECTAAGLSSNYASPQVHGVTITFTGTSASCAQPDYLFYLKNPRGVWSLMQGYGGSTWAWKTAGVASTGSYLVDVWVRPHAAKVTYQIYTTMSFTLT